MKIPIPPLSVNACWKGRRFKTKEYDQWRKDVSYFMKGEKILGNVEIRIIFYLKSVVRSDLDNFVKTAIDSIVIAGLIDDDRYVQRLVCEKRKSKEEGFEVFITKFLTQ